MTDAELEHQITLAAEQLRDWNREAESRRSRHSPANLQDAYDRVNQWHARLNYLEGLQKGRNNE